MTTKRSTLLDHAKPTGAEFLTGITPGGLPPEAAAPPAPAEETPRPPASPKRKKAAPEPSDERNVSFTFRLPQELHDQVKREAMERYIARGRGGLDLSEVVREALEEYFQRKERQK
jgi:hypothetical protein